MLKRMEAKMSEKEITQAKQCALTTKDWDSYQIILRTCLSPAGSNHSFKQYPVPQNTGNTINSIRRPNVLT